MPQPRRARRTPGAAASLLAASLVVGLVVLAVLGGCTSASDSGSSGAPDKGYISGNGTVAFTGAGDRSDPVELTGSTLEGEPFDLADHRGKVVVVNVWGSWCPPCIAEAPALQEVWERTRGSGVQFVGIDTRDQRAAAVAHQRRFSVTYPSVDDDGGRALLALRGSLPPTAIPSTLVLDREGRVAARVLGQVRAATLAGLVEDVLAEPRAGA